MRKASIPHAEGLESIKNVVSGRELEKFLVKYVRKQILKHDYTDVLVRQPDQTQLKAIVKILSRGTDHIDNVVYNFEQKKKDLSVQAKNELFQMEIIVKSTSTFAHLDRLMTALIKLVDLSRRQWSCYLTKY